MEFQDDCKNSLTAFEADEQCTIIRPTGAISGSGSDEDNGEAPPSSFSIDGEHQTRSQEYDENDYLKSPQVATNETSLPNEDHTSEADDEQPPVTWFVTRPTCTQPINTLQYYGFDMSAQKSQLCKLCLVGRKTFYCMDCVSKGEFNHSDSRRPGNFIEKKDRRSAIQRRTDIMIAEIERKTAQKLMCQQLGEDIRMCQQRIKYLRHLIRGSTEKKERAQEAAKKYGLMNEKREQRLPLFIDKVSKIRRYTSQYIGDLDKERLNVAQKCGLLNALRRSHVRKLFELVFPVEKVLMSTISSSKLSANSKMSSMTSSEDEISAAIESLMVDAMSTSYVQGHGWVTLSPPDLQGANSNFSTAIDSSGAKQPSQLDEDERIVYKIVAPYLPADGDYSTFPAMVIAANDQIQSTIPSMAQDHHPTHSPVAFAVARAQGLGSDSSTEDEISPIHTISAGLTFTAQLVSQISACLDVILPKYLSYNDFGVPIASEYKFAKKVTKLNLNIIFLCLNHGVLPEEIHPTHSLYNLHLLFTNIKCKDRNQNVSQAERTNLIEKFYDLSVLSASTLDRHSPTSEDLINDSDEGLDEDKVSKDNMDDWEAVATGVGATGDMMIVNLPQLNTTQNFNWVMSTSPSSPIQSPSSYGMGHAASSATSFMSSLIRGFTGGNNTSTTYEPFTSPKK